MGLAAHKTTFVLFSWYCLYASAPKKSLIRAPRGGKKSLGMAFKRSSSTLMRSTHAVIQSLDSDRPKASFTSFSNFQNSFRKSFQNNGATGEADAYGIRMLSYLPVSGFLVLYKVDEKTRHPSQVIPVSRRWAAVLEVVHQLFRAYTTSFSMAWGSWSSMKS